MYWNNGHVVGGETGAAFYETEPLEGLGSLGLGAIYAGVYNEEVLGAQERLNDLAAALNYELLAEDGKLGKKTCGALKFWFYEAPKDLLMLAPDMFDAALIYMQQHQAVGNACSHGVAQPWVAPKPLGPPPQPASAPAPTTPSVEDLTPEQIAYLCTAKRNADGMLAACDIPECYALNRGNCDAARSAAATPQYTPDQIRYLCMAKIAQDGTLAACDVPECYQLDPSVCDQLRAAAPGCFKLMGEQGVAAACGVPDCYKLNPTNCDRVMSEEPSYTFEEPEVVAPSGSCEFNYGDSHPQVALLQQQLNVALVAGGYNPIPVTGVYDAETCGAIFELRGTFEPSPSQLCPGGWEVPFSCASVKKPTKRSDSPPTLEPKKKVSKAALIGGAALLTAVVGGALYAAKTKGGV